MKHSFTAKHTEHLPKGETFFIEVHHYRYGNTICLRVVDKNGAPELTATVNIPEVSPPLLPDEVLIKNYHENIGIYNDLYLSGIISTTSDIVPAGHSVALRCRLLIPQ
jgi:hypothetical protein